MKLKTIQTCGACPEQYEVFDDTGKEVAYLRLRWGKFTADVLGDDPQAMGYYYEVYNYIWENEPMLGLFPNEEEREHHIRQALNAIEKELERRNQ